MYTLSHPTPVMPIQNELDGFRYVGIAWVFLFQCLIMTLPTLKLLHLGGVGDLSWHWVTLPFWGPGALLSLLLLAERALGFRKTENELILHYLSRY